jgi:hypothetical protein
MLDPRGPIRQIVSIEERTDATLCTLTCGHVARFNQTFSYKVGSDQHCIQCKDLASQFMDRVRKELFK